jgi:hypothetical protein
MAEWTERAELLFKKRRIRKTTKCIGSRPWWRGIFAAEFWLEQEWEP